MDWRYEEVAHIEEYEVSLFADLNGADLVAETDCSSIRLITYPVQLLRRIKAVFRQSTQGFSDDGFAQVCDSTRRQHLRTRRLVGKTRYKNCWYGETVGETSMELNPSQTCHMQVGNQTRRVRKSSADE